MSYIDNLIKGVNQSIEDIKSHGLQPITLKSPADIIEKFIEPKGTSKEGQFKTYTQYIDQYGYITEEQYESVITDFIAEYAEQFDLRGAIEYKAEETIARLEKFIPDETMSRIYEMTDDEIVKMIQWVGETTNEAKANGAMSDVFYYYLEQYLDDFFGDE